MVIVPTVNITEEFYIKYNNDIHSKVYKVKSNIKEALMMIHINEKSNSNIYVNKLIEDCSEQRVEFVFLIVTKRINIIIY